MARLRTQCSPHDRALQVNNGIVVRSNNGWQLTSDSTYGFLLPSNPSQRGHPIVTHPGIVPGRRISETSVISPISIYPDLSTLTAT